jgi:hypothetical protein
MTPPSWASGSGAGVQYRLYFLEDGHISKSHEFIADNDDAAIEITENWREGRDAELWCHSRKVRSWKGSSA